MPADPVRVLFLVEQLLQPVPGGIGTYVRAMLERLPRHQVDLTPGTAWHPRRTLRRLGLDGARRHPLARRPLYWSWALTGLPGVGGGAELLHAPSLAFPPRHRGPLVVTVHDVAFLDHPAAYPSGGRAFHLRMLARLGAADLVLCPSTATAEAVGDAVPAVRVAVVPLGTDLAPPPPDVTDRVLAALGVDRPYVLWVGTLEPRKNPEGVIRGFARAATRAGAALHLYLCGPQGWWRRDLRTELERAGIADRVRWLGPQPGDRLAALYSGAAVFVFPSIAEGFGLPVLEAMACGAPVVASDRSSLPEVAGGAALPCDPFDPDSIAEAILRVVEDDDLAGDLRRRGRHRAAALTWDRTAAETARWYRRVLGREP